MDLKIKDVAELFNVTETTVRRWLIDGKIPTYRLENQDRFSRIEIEDWIMRHRQNEDDQDYPFGSPSKDSPDDNGLKGKARGSKQFSLYRALHKGNILTNIPGETKTEVIIASVKMIADDLHLDADVITDLLLDRENLQPTALNNGIGLPHTRDCFLSGQDVVTIVFPSKPIPYGALDGLPVHTLFFLFACEDKRHLHLLAKIAHLSSQPAALELLQSKPSKAEFLEFVKDWENSIQQR